MEVSDNGDHWESDTSCPFPTLEDCMAGCFLEMAALEERFPIHFPRRMWTRNEFNRKARFVILEILVELKRFCRTAVLVD
jgi:hypothetical protein